MASEIGVRIRWSDIPKGVPVKIFVDMCKSQVLWYNDYYVVVPAFMNFESLKKVRHFSLVVPYDRLVRAFLLRPVREQKLLLDGVCEVCLKKFSGGVLKVYKIKKYEGIKK